MDALNLSVEETVPAARQRTEPYCPFNDNPFNVFVRAWLAEPTSPDPFESLIQLQKAEANYLERERGDTAGALQARRFAERLERVIEAIRSLDISYEMAAEISVWTYGTIKNKAAAGEIATNEGRVQLSQLLIGPATTGLHALRAVDEISSASRRRGERAVSARGRGSAAAKRMYDLGRKSSGG